MSNINPNNIDGTFPIAGQDNSSQGFRDNFTNIRNNLSYAQSEITELQQKAITTTNLSGSTLTNDMAYNQIYRAQLFSPSLTLLDKTTVTVGATVNFDYSQGSVQKLTTAGGAGTFTLSFSNWPPSGQYGSMLLWLSVTSASHVMSFVGSNVTQGLADIAGGNAVNSTITFDQPGDFLLKLETTNGGSSILITDASRNGATFRDPNFYFNDNVVNTLLVGFGTNSAVTSYAIAADAGRSTIVSAGQHSSVSVGNLSLANLTYGTLDTGSLAGYNITSARGNLQTGTFTPVLGNDLLGYHNAVTYTGNVNNGNTFQQVSTIAFYATGSNVTYGLGGNIVFATGKDGDVVPNHTVYQAVGIENDQSTKFFGNVVTANVFVPTSTTTAGGKAGQLSFDASYLYVCIAPGNWKRVALSTF